MTTESRLKLSMSLIGRKLTEEHKRKIGNYNLKHPTRHWLGKHTPSGENSGTWKGDDASYSSVHKWLYRHYGKAEICESPDCKKVSKSYQWALLKGLKYTHKRNNFWQLCGSCHHIYDGLVKNLHVKN